MNKKPKGPYEFVIKSQPYVPIRTAFDDSEDEESDDIFSEFETEQSKTRKSSNFGEIKQEIVDCDGSKFEHRPWDLPAKDENEQFFSTIIKKEPTDILDVVEKQEGSENIQGKIKSELLATSIDLPTLKSESHDYTDNLEQICNSKHAKRTLKMLKTTPNVSKKRRRRYPCDVFQKDLSNESGKSDKFNDSDPDWELPEESETDIVQGKTNLQTCTVNYKKKYKNTFCIFCEQFVVSKHFSRHIQQRHKKKGIVQSLLNAQSEKEKRLIIMVIRNKGNFQLKTRNSTFIPKKCMRTFKNKVNDANYSICVKCKGYFRKTNLVRHYKNCLITDNNPNPKVDSFLLSLETSYQKLIKKDPMKKELLNKLRLDDIDKTVDSDPTIIEHDVQLLLTNKDLKQRATLARNKIRECARLLTEIKNLILGQPLPERDLFLSDTEPEKEIPIPHQRRRKRPLSDLSDSDSSHSAGKEKFNNTKKNEPSRRRPWSSTEVNLLKEHFSKHIMSNESLYPSGKELKVFADKFLKSQRSVAQVKSKIQHIRKLVKQ